MKNRTLLIAALAAAHAAAFAQPGPPPGRHGPGGPPHMQGHRPPMAGPQHAPMHRPGMRPMPHRPPPPVAYPEYRRYHRGDRLPPNLRARQYVVQDWRGHGLRQPPRGYQWVQNGSDYVLAAVATGIISAVVIHALTQ